MGNQQDRSRQHVYICIAGLSIILLFGCAALGEIKNRQYARESLLLSETLLAEGDFNGALRENGKVLSLFGKDSPADEAIFNTGLIYAHYGNPDKNYQKAGFYFMRVIEDYPESPLSEQAKIWMGVLNELDAEKVKMVAYTSTQGNLLYTKKLVMKGEYKEALQENLKIQSDFEGRSPADEAIFNIGLIYSYPDNPEKDYKKAGSYFTKLIREHPDSPLTVQAEIWIGILNIIEKSKQVDIEIEQKKKEQTR